jgi:hypothetical protein
MNFDLSEENLKIREMTRSFAEREVISKVKEYEQNKEEKACFH